MLAHQVHILNLAINKKENNLVKNSSKNKKSKELKLDIHTIIIMNKIKNQKIVKYREDNLLNVNNIAKKIIIVKKNSIFLLITVNKKIPG